MRLRCRIGIHRTRYVCRHDFRDLVVCESCRRYFLEDYSQNGDLFRDRVSESVAEGIRRKALA
jgi:hypothetical protein